MNHDEIEQGLAARGFVGIEGMDSMGECHKDEKHFILRTDGLIIYSDIPFWTNTEYHPGSKYVMWTAELDDDDVNPRDPEFTFEELDKILCK